MSGKGAAKATDEVPSLRIDKLLWYLRLSRSRSMAKKLAEKGHIRLNGRRVDRGHISVRQNDILTLPAGREVKVVRVVSLPQRRGDSVAAQSCYEQLATGG